jgi:dienelactone hydrolase
MNKPTPLSLAGPLSCALISLVLASLLASCTTVRDGEAQTGSAIRFDAPAIRHGFAPQMSVSGLEPRETVRVASVRTFEVWTNDDGTGWKPKNQPVIAWADAQADRKGRIDLGRISASTGTWRGADPYGLVWSGRKAGSRDVPADLAALLPIDAVKAGEGFFYVVGDNAVKAVTPMLFAEPDGLTVVPVDAGNLNGVFAAPEGETDLPTVILLHGSEGGSRDSARELAARYAGHGFAALAVNYFAWDMSGIETVPNVHVNMPIERLDDARAWLSTRPEADLDRLGVYGHSKGAEFATVAATKYPWIKAVSACVPSDSVWEGYGIGDPRAQRARPEPDPPADAHSSWSWKGAPMPFIPLKRYYAEKDRTYFNNSELYERARNDNPARARAAEIPIETAKARFLLSGGAKDEVWASGAMAEQLNRRMIAAGRGGDVILQVFPQAGHGICGAGTYPPFLWADSSDDPRAKDPAAEGPATIETWQRTVRFFKDTL